MHVTHTTATHRREKNGETDGSTTSKCYWASASGRDTASCGQSLWGNKTNISNLWRRNNATGNVRDRPRSGRPRVTSAVQDRYIRLRHLRDRTLAASATTTAIPAGLWQISNQTVRNRLREAGLAARRPVIRNLLTSRHLAERL